jgi:membrane protein
MATESQESSASRSSIRQVLSVSYLVVKESLFSFSTSGNFGGAATLAYYGFLSLMPLLLLVVFLLGAVMKSSEAILHGMTGLMNQLFPAFSDAVLGDLVALSQQKVWGLVSVVVLIWSMTPFAGAMRDIMARIFKSERRMNYFKAKLYDFAAVLALLSVFLLMAGGKVFQSMAGDRLPWFLSSSAHFAQFVVAPLFVLTVLCFLYVAFAPVRLRLAQVLAGSVTAALLLAVIRPVFGLFLQFNPDYGYAFGSLKAVFLVIIWAYYTFAVILLGAEVIANVRRREALLLKGLFVPEKGGAVSRTLLDRFIRTCGEGEVLFREGDSGNEMYYVLSGEVSLSRKGSQLIALKEGGYFGEMSMLLSAPRTATATVAAPGTKLVMISHDNFDTILRENPGIVQTILKEMASRLKTTNERIEPAHP